MARHDGGGSSRDVRYGDVFGILLCHENGLAIDGRSNSRDGTRVFSQYNPRQPYGVQIEALKHEDLVARVIGDQRVSTFRYERHS